MIYFSISDEDLGAIQQQEQVSYTTIILSFILYKITLYRIFSQRVI